MGTIEGYVLGGDEPMHAKVTAKSVGGDESAIDVSVLTDSTGFYQLTVPRGFYQLSASRFGSQPDAPWSCYYSRRGPQADSDDADTVGVFIDPVSADFVGGVLVIGLQVPELLIGSRVTCELDQGSDGFRRMGRSTSVTVDGSYVEIVYPFLPPRRYTMGLRLPEAPAIWLPPTHIAAKADTVEVRSGELHTYQAVLEAPGILTGTVRGSWQELYLDEPRVTVHASETDLLDATHTELDGSFAFHLYARESIRLRLDISGIQRWVGAGRGYETAQEFTLAPGERDSVAVLEYAIHCTFERPPIDEGSSAVLRLVDAGGGDLLEDEFNVDMDEEVVLPNLDAGTYYLHIGHPTYYGRSWIEQWYADETSLAEATPVEIDPNEFVLSLDIQLTAGGTISGHVYAWNGSPLQDAKIYLAPVSDSTAVVYTGERTWSDGRFRVKGLRDDEYKIAAEPYWKTFRWYPGTTDWDSAGVLTIVAHGDLTGIDWTHPR